MANEFKVKKGLIVYGSGSTIFDVQGSQGQLFSVTDDLVGDVFSVNDISGLPILTVNTDEIVTMGTFGTNALVVSGSSVGVGTSEPTQKLHVAGNARIEGSLYDSTNSSGTTGQILKSTGTGTTWSEDIYLQKSTGTTYTINNLLALTQTEYDALSGTTDANTLYFIL